MCTLIIFVFIYLAEECKIWHLEENYKTDEKVNSLQ